MTEQTEKLRKGNQELELLTKKDYVADIFNKSYLLILLGKIIKNIKFQESVLIYLVDIVNIDEINGVIGPETEERVFESAANMLRECISSDTVLARLDREKFVLISSGNINKNEAEQTVKTIIQYCSAPLQIDKYELYLILNIGMAIYPGDGLESDELIKKAELALLQAKKIGTNQYFYFEDFCLKMKNEKHN
jgi:diguanylate cyclase (GGDEF)-like protein